MKPSAEPIDYEVLVDLLNQAKATPSNAPVTKTGIPALDRAIRNLDSVTQFTYLLFELVELRCAMGSLDQEQIDKQVKARHAEKLLQEAGAILSEIGSPRLADLCSDLEAGARKAAMGVAFMQYLGPVPPSQGGDFRLYAHQLGGGNIIAQRNKTKGRAANHPESAAIGAAVRSVANHFDEQIPERAAIIASLCCLVGYPVTGQSVTKMLVDYPQKPSPAKPPVSDNWLGKLIT